MHTKMYAGCLFLAPSEYLCTESLRDRRPFMDSFFLTQFVVFAEYLDEETLRSRLLVAITEADGSFHLS